MNLPESWTEATVAEIADAKLGKMLDAAKNEGIPTRYLRNVNVRWGDFDLSDLQEMKVKAEELDSLSVRDGDIFVCEGGEPGRSAVWRGGPSNLTFQKALHRLRVRPGVDPNFVSRYLKHATDVGLLDPLLTGTTIRHLPQVALGRLRIPLPPSAEQRRIVAKLDVLNARLERVRAELDRVTSRGDRVGDPRSLLDRLEAAILAKAFRGELVSQDINDEPGSVLLDRIRAERATPAKARRVSP
ncbi:MAG: restriction endonuclease subunit S [Bauldia sp.]|nr:restriction endonuclease subunit S [Bauldia sp.]